MAASNVRCLRHRMLQEKGRKRCVFITRLDLDHLPLKDYIAGARMKFYVAPPIFQGILRRYGEAFEVEEYSDILMVKDEYLYMGRTRGNYAFIYFIHDAVVIPECCNASELIEEYGLKYAFVFVFTAEKPLQRL